MPENERFYRVKPDISELLPEPELMSAFDEASAAIEAGRFVRRLRNEAGLTQAELAEKLAMTQARVSAIELGKGRDGPSYALLRRIAAACGISMRSILEEAIKSMHASIKNETPQRYSAF